LVFWKVIISVGQILAVGILGFGYFGIVKSSGFIIHDKNCKFYERGGR
jgi:hypothetical protein